MSGKEELDMNAFIAERNKLQAEIWKLKIELEKAEKALKPLNKAFSELLDEAMTYRERMGIEMDNRDYEYGWMERAGLL
jgi:hypothetical protein